MTKRQRNIRKARFFAVIGSLGILFSLYFGVFMYFSGTFLPCWNGTEFNPVNKGIRMFLYILCLVVLILSDLLAIRGMNYLDKVGKSGNKER